MFIGAPWKVLRDRAWGRKEEEIVTDGVEWTCPTAAVKPSGKAWWL